MANVNMPKNSGNKKKATQKPRKGSENSARDVNMTFPCVSRVLDQSRVSVSMQPDSNMPQQLTFCSPHGLPMMPVTQFQQQTYIVTFRSLLILQLNPSLHSHS